MGRRMGALSHEIIFNWPTLYCESCCNLHSVHTCNSPALAPSPKENGLAENDRMCQGTSSIDCNLKIILRLGCCIPRSLKITGKSQGCTRIDLGARALYSSTKRNALS